MCMRRAWGGRLWNISRDNLSCLKGPKARPRAPDLADFLAPVITEMDPEQGIEEPYKVRAPPDLALHLMAYLPSSKRGNTTVL